MAHIMTETNAKQIPDSNVTETDRNESVETENRTAEPVYPETGSTEKSESLAARTPEHEDAPDVTVQSVVEAVLFATEEPISIIKIANIIETTTDQVKEALQALNQSYRQNGNAFHIEKIAGGYQLLTLPAYHFWLKKLVKVKGESKLSPSALETLAIVAYKQPVTRAEIESIRGVASGEMLRNLLVKGLVKITGRADIIGRPMLYGTTQKFLESFGLAGLKDLPKIEELKKPEGGSQGPVRD